LKIVFNFFRGFLGASILNITIIASLALSTLFTVYKLLQVTISSYTNVPIMDEWDARVRLTQNPNVVSFLWDQHNEHRIILTKILSLLTYYFFSGQIWPMVVINYLLAFIILIQLYFLAPQNWRSGTWIKRLILSLCLFLLVFNPIQIDNFIGGIQAQEFLVIIFPLACFHQVAKYVGNDVTSHRQLHLAIILGIIAIGTMANGVLTLGLAFITLCFLGQINRSTALLGAVGLVNVLVYFYRFQQPNGHSSPLETFIQHPFFSIKFVALYLSSPIYSVYTANNFFIAGIFVLLLLSVFCWSLLRLYRIKTSIKENIELFTLAIMMLFLILTMFITSLGRYNFGVASAAGFRYTTNTFVVWSITLLMILHLAELQSKQVLVTLSVLSLVFFFLTIPFMNKLAIDYKKIAFNQRLGEIAIKMEVPDESALVKIYPWPDRLRMLKETYLDGSKFIIGRQDFDRAIEEWRIVSTKLPTKCTGHVDTVTLIPGTRFVRIEGWFFNPSFNVQQSTLLIRSGKGRIIGFGVNGSQRVDVSSIYGGKGMWSGFTAYSESSFIPLQDSIASPENTCSLGEK